MLGLDVASRPDEAECILIIGKVVDKSWGRARRTGPDPVSSALVHAPAGVWGCRQQVNRPRL